ncbi:MAG: DNA-processing protein DprA [Candidatus Eremiobacteraeota bacterium]|nr:DNA-processing protein DprA [Candidatus Eremiobacteraeota bacterium]MBV8433316.1 DNA-processing protein DprA [Candidatus Eremiobacteraeota bacterium]MBV8722357.1 DNA-processing protein DprA [Candidatus Eremiobacteraeota bacterium]
MHVLGRLPEGGVAIVGSRTPPDAACVFAFELARRLGEPVISGLANGIDTMAHRGALAAGMPTLAFVGYGFGCTDPPENEELERAIVEHGGGVATLREPRTPVSPDGLIERDRLQAQHARAVVLVCTEVGGGAMHTLRFARELGKPRFAVAPPDDVRLDAAWGGNLQAIADGAIALPFDVEKALDAIAIRH